MQLLQQQTSPAEPEGATESSPPAEPEGTGFGSLRNKADRLFGIAWSHLRCRAVLTALVVAVALTVTAEVLLPGGAPRTNRSATRADHSATHPVMAPAGSYLPMVATAAAWSVDLYPAPGRGKPQVWASLNQYGVPAVFLVKQVQGSWLDVYVPQRPNGSTSWVRVTQVSLALDDYKVVAHLATHTVVVSDGSRTILSVPDANGAPSTPTPSGTWFITELLRQPNPNGAYGPYAYGLSAFSNVYYHFDGGPGQIGFHGTNSPASIGHAASSGCIRLSNSDILKLVPILPLGTPVIVEQ